GGNADATRRSTKFHAGLGRGGATACRKPGTRLMRWGSGRAHGGAARAALAIELQSIAQGPLAPGAARVAQLEMVRPAGAGGLLLGVAGGAAPNTFSEGHSGPLPHGFPPKFPRRASSGVAGHGDRGAGPARTTIGAAEFAPLPSATPPLTCDVDVFRAAPAVDAVRLRVRVRAAVSARWIVALSTADAAAPDLRLAEGAAARLEVPALSQME